MSRVPATKTFAWTSALLVILSALPLSSMFSAAAPSPLVVTAADEVFPQFGVTPRHSFAPNVSGRGFNDTLLKWRLPLAVSSGGTTVANFSSDIALNNTTGKPEYLGVVVGHPNGAIPGTSLVTILAGNNATTMWTYPITGNIFATPIAADVNADGRMDLVIRGDNGEMVAVTPNITWDGSNFNFPLGNLSQVIDQQIWNRSVIGDTSTDNNLSTPIAVNTIGGAAPELLVPAGDRLFYLNGADGAEIRNQTVDGTIVSAPTAFQLGGGWIILVASTNRTTANITTVASDFIVTAFDTSLNFLWNQSYPQTYATSAAYKSLDLQLPSPAAGNLDGAGPFDDWALVTPYEGSLARLRIFYNGSNSFAYNATLQGLTGSAPAVVDLDGDGRDEIVTMSYEPGTPIASPNSRVFIEVFAGNGTRVWNVSIDEVPGAPRENVLAPPAIADLNNDGVKDVALLLTDGASEVRSGTNGSRILRHQAFDQATPTEFSAPAVADLDYDGFLDLTANAAVVSFALADLWINGSDISVNNTVPDQFENISVTATVHNAGNAAARNVTVEFFDGLSKLNQSNLTLILPGTNALANVVVNFTSGGVRTLRVVVDGNNSIDELDESNNTASIPLNVSSLFGFRLESPLNRTVVPAGFGYVFAVNVISEGTQLNVINLSFSNLPSGWSASLSPGHLNVTAAGSQGDTNTSFFSVTTAALALPGEYDLSVSAVSAYSTRNSASMTFTVIVGGQFGVAVYPLNQAKNVTAGNTVIYSFDVFNAGNSPDTIVINNTPPAAGWLVVLSLNQTNLPAAGSTRVSAIVRSPAAASSGDNDTVTITATSQADSTKKATTVLRTTVVVPDLVVTSIRFYRECGGEAVGGAPRLVQGDVSQISIEVANAAANAEISGVVLRVFVDGGAPMDWSVSIGPNGVGFAEPINFTWSTPGVKVVTAQVDPMDSISEISESNNDLTSQVTVKDTVPVGDLTVRGMVTRDGLGVPSAGVTLANPATGANFSSVAAGDGQYVIVVTAASYFDGDTLYLNATDGLDVGNTTVCAYSEDGQALADIAMGLPSPYDFLLTALGPADQSAVPGSVALYSFNLTNRGGLNSTIIMSATGPWPTRIMDANGSSTSVVTLAPNGSALVRVEVTVPLGSAAGTAVTTTLNATAIGANPARSRAVNFTTHVGVLRQLNLTLDLGTATALAGTNVSVNVTVRNLGNSAENVTLTVSCQGVTSCGTWAVPTSSPLVVLVGGSATALVTIHVPAFATGGGYTVDFLARSNDDFNTAVNATLPLTVLEKRYEFSVTGSSTLRLFPGQTRSTNLTLTNGGTVPDSYLVSTSPVGFGFTVTLQPGGTTAITVDVLAGQAVTITVSVSAPPDPGLESFPIDILVESVEGQSQSLVSLTALVGTIYDFRITGPVIPDPPQVDKEILVYVTVRNVGERPFAGDLPVRLHIGGEIYETQTITNLAVDEEKTLAFRWTAHFAGPVDVSIDVNMVAGSTIYESSFANNVAARSVTVEPVKPGEFLSSTGLLLMLIAVIAVLLAVAAVTRRKEDTATLEDHEKAKEESDDRRLGKGPGGLEKL